jgi:hypothetical protein
MPIANADVTEDNADMKPNVLFMTPGDWPTFLGDLW